VPRDFLSHPEDLIRRVYSYAAYRLGDGPDAEDATSDAFERALRYRESFDPRKGTPLAWMIGIARRSVDDLLAARTPLVAEPPDVPTDDRDSVLHIDLSRAVERLEERDRELVALRYGADLTAKQIAAQLWDLAAVASHAQRLLELADDACTSLAPGDPRALADSFLVSVATVRFLRSEPQLPRQIVGEAWPADRLRTTYGRLEREYATVLGAFVAENAAP